jgi:hypothetical protein
VKILEVGQKEPRTIPWAQVTDVEKGKYGDKPAAVQPGSAGPGYAQPVPVQQPARVEDAPPATLGDPGVVRLHVDSPQPVQVSSRKTAQGAVNNGYGYGYGFVLTQLTPVCVSPCDKVIDGSRGQEFIATGDFPGTKAFTLSGMKGDVDLAVKPGSRGLRALGVTSLILGGSAVILGGTFTLLGGLGTNSTNALGVTTYGMASETKIGLAMLGSGGALLVGGIVALVASGTHFDLHAKEATTAQRPRYWLGQF